MSKHKRKSNTLPGGGRQRGDNECPARQARWQRAVYRPAFYTSKAASRLRAMPSFFMRK
jgi:hypothetical protein